MKQNNFYIPILAAVLGGATLTACKPKSAATASEGEAVVLGPQHSKKGLLLPEDTRLSLGVKIVEVTEQRVSATLDLPLRVYQAGDGGGKASGTVMPEQAEKLRAGQPVELQAADGQTFTGTITRMSDELRKATGTFEILVEFRPVPTGVLAGALLQCSDGYSVFTVSGEHLVRTPVKVGVANTDRVEITDGLYSGDQVVLQPVMSLWMTELAAVKGGQACCVMPAKGK